MNTSCAGIIQNIIQGYSYTKQVPNYSDWVQLGKGAPKNGI
jgi:hypothetical protein